MQNNKSDDLQTYQASLDAFIKINNLITEHSQWGKSLTERDTLNSYRDSTRGSFMTLEDKVIGYLNSVENTERSRVGPDTERKQNNNIDKENHLKEREINIESKEKALTTLANKLKEKEKSLSAFENRLKLKETGLIEQEKQMREEMQKLNQLKQLPSHLNCSLIPLLNYENTETITFKPNIKPDTQLQSMNIAPANNLEEYVSIIRELEEMNSDMITRNETLQGEVSKLSVELQQQKNFIIKEAEKLSDKENSLNYREQTLVTRESKLVERTKFMNTTLKSVNHYIKTNSEQEHHYENKIFNPPPNSAVDNNQCEYTSEDLTFKGFLRNLNEIKDFSNVPRKSEY